MPGDAWFEEPGDELLDDEFPEEDEFDDDLSDTVPCSQCGAEIYEDAVRCPACGAYLAHDTRPWSRRPSWWIVLGLLGTLAAMLALLCRSAG
ncbi:MAG: zinc-ribbon domain-containing protein [Planctomycetota bacterium]|jgi:hypothetical protein